MSDSSALILLSTFNGEKWLNELLISLREQKTTQWTLLVRDDASSDSTKEILKKAALADSRIKIIEDDLGNLGPTKSFSKLLELSLNYPQNYIFFCDQDDLWMPDKLSHFLEEFHKAEQSLGSTIPLLIHSQLKTCDETGIILNVSYHRYMNFDPEHSQNKLSHLLVQNFIVGCSSAINKSLSKIAAPIPDEAMMHDWWSALIACVLGKIIFIDEALTCYRIHSQNASGAGQSGLAKKLRSTSKLMNLIDSRSLQAEKLLERLTNRSTQASQNKFKYIEEFVENLNDKNLKSFIKLLRMNLKMQGTDRTLAFYLTTFLRSIGL